MAKHSAPVSILSWAFLTLGLVLFGLAGLGWYSHLGDEGEVVANNVDYAGSEMEGMTEDEVMALVATRADDLLSRKLTIEYGQGELTVPYGELGFSYDEEATAAAVMATRHQGSVWDQFASWAMGELITAEVEEVWRLDAVEARSALDDHPELTPTFVAEPRIEATDSGKLAVVPGVIGTEADVDDIVEQLGAIDLIAAPDSISTSVEQHHPTVGDDEATATADHLNELTGRGVRISVEGRQAVVTALALQRVLRIEIGNGEITTGFDPDQLQDTIENTIVGPVGTFVEPVLSVTDEVVELVTPGEAPPVCCEEGVGAQFGYEILSGTTGPVRLPSRPTDDPDLLAWADGSAVSEKVSEFTTPHNCCEARVQNIHRIADMVRGVYLIPGETFSLNQFVGPRTIENGFVPAGAIRQGHLIQEIGGGVSQFATTIFNAAYFAGLEFVEYRSHSIYFSRYPYGREATISNPAPDLAFTNTTDFPVLIWTSYTDESITVSMFSTKNVEVTELDQRTSRRGVCTHVETDRQRVFADGRTVVDTILADYRPAEGIDCNGNRIPPPTA